jgi:hypothetical protein
MGFDTTSWPIPTDGGYLYRAKAVPGEIQIQAATGN